jgi:hypothetical protein
MAEIRWIKANVGGPGSKGRGKRFATPQNGEAKTAPSVVDDPLRGPRM